MSVPADVFAALNPLLSEDGAQRYPDLATVSSGLIAAIAGTRHFVPSNEALLQEAGLGQSLREQAEELAQTVRQSRSSAMGLTAFNVARGLFPVVLDGRIVAACLDTGPIKVGALSADQADAIRKAGGDPAPLQEGAGLPTLPAKQLASVYDLYERLAAQFAAQLSQPSSMPTESLQAAELASGLSRHYNKLLSVILGYASVSIGRDDLPEDVSQSLQRLHDAAAEGKDLSGVLFASGGESHEPGPVALHKVIRRVLPLLDAHRSADVTVSQSLDAARDTVMAAPHAMHQFVFNLVTLAMDLAPLGSEVTLETDNRAGELALRVYDAKAQPFDETSAFLTMGLSAFGPVGDLDLKRRLSVLVRHMETLGGSARVKPQPGRMTSIECSLPLVAPSPLREIPAPPAKVIWMVDDDRWFHPVCRELLSDQGYELVGYESFEELQSAWSSAAPPELLLVDFLLGEHDGAEVRDWIAERSDVPVILVSSLSSLHPGIEHALTRPHTYYLAKPVEKQDLIDMVSLALGLTLLGS